MLDGFELEIPGREPLHLQHLVLDVNGTIALDGRLREGVSVRLARLDELLEVHLLTADTHGHQAEIDRVLRLTAHRVEPGQEAAQKAAYVQRLEGGCVALGNGQNDVGMLEAADLGIAVLGGEGLASATLRVADLLVHSVTDGLDLLIHPARLRATLRS